MTAKQFNRPYDEAPQDIKDIVTGMATEPPTAGTPLDATQPLEDTPVAAAHGSDDRYVITLGTVNEYDADTDRMEMDARIMLVYDADDETVGGVTWDTPGAVERDKDTYRVLHTESYDDIRESIEDPDIGFRRSRVLAYGHGKQA